MSDGPHGSRDQGDAREILLLSDLHMGAGAAGGAPDDFDADAAFASFADSLCRHAAGDPGPRRLVILGDLLDLLRLAQTDARERVPEQPVAAALDRMDRIAAGHPEAFAALGRLAAAGYGLDVVPGNHDLDLMRPAAQERLREIVCGADGRLRERVRFHPWLVHVPGLLYAEHGSQYHDINRFPTLLAPWGAEPDGALDAPLGAHLGVDAGSGGPLPAARRAACVARGMAADTRLRGARGRPGAVRSYRDRVLGPYADELSLPREAVADIDRLSATSTPRMVARVLRAMATGRGGYDLRGPAREIHRLLTSRGAGVSCYVFAHSHAADRIPLPGGEIEASYLNTGTWSIPRPRPGLPLSGRRMTYVSVTRPRSGGPATARLMRWDAERARHEALS